MKFEKSKKLFLKAKEIFPGGVNSPVRAFQSVGGQPLFIKKAKGAYLTDVDGNRFIDYVCSWGPLILGHAPDVVLRSIFETAQYGTSFGAPHQLEIELAKKIQKHFPSIEKIRFVNSGTEAVLSAIRLARAYTQRDKIIKFSGCYHGHADSLLVQAGSGALTLGIPNSAGVPKDFAKHTLTAKYNSIAEVEALFKKYPDQIAAVLIEPVVGNSGCILPENDFLNSLQKICKQENALFIFDEVMTGFRVSLGGAQKKYQMKADLTTLGKVIGGGLPVGALGGKREILDRLAPAGNVYQAGTLSGNPLAMAAGLSTLENLEKAKAFSQIEKNTQILCQEISILAQRHSLALQTPQSGAMMGLFFSENKVKCLQDIPSQHPILYKKFFHAMLQEKIYLPPSAYEAWFMSSTHQEKEIQLTLKAINKVFKNL